MEILIEDWHRAPSARGSAGAGLDRAPAPATTRRSHPKGSNYRPSRPKTASTDRTPIPPQVRTRGRTCPRCRSSRPPAPAKRPRPPWFGPRRVTSSDRGHLRRSRRRSCPGRTYAAGTRTRVRKLDTDTHRRASLQLLGRDKTETVALIPCVTHGSPSTSIRPPWLTSRPALISRGPVRARRQRHPFALAMMSATICSILGIVNPLSLPTLRAASAGYLST